MYWAEIRGEMKRTLAIAALETSGEIRIATDVQQLGVME